MPGFDDKVLCAGDDDADIQRAPERDLRLEVSPALNSNVTKAVEEVNAWQNRARWIRVIRSFTLVPFRLAHPVFTPATANPVPLIHQPINYQTKVLLAARSRGGISALPRRLTREPR